MLHGAPLLVVPPFLPCVPWLPPLVQPPLGVRLAAETVPEVVVKASESGYMRLVDDEEGMVMHRAAGEAQQGVESVFQGTDDVSNTVMEPPQLLAVLQPQRAGRPLLHLHLHERVPGRPPRGLQLRVQVP